MAGEPTPLIRVFPADDGGCLGGHYRLIWPAEAAARAGGNVHIGGPLREVRRKRVEGGRVVDERLDVETDADVVVYQRLIDRDVVDTIPHLQANGVAVVVDIDDDLDALPKGHPYRAATSPTRERRRFADGTVDDPDRKNRLWLREACRQADLVTVSTPALAERYGRHGRVAVLPNCVPAAYLDIDPPAHDGVRVGWTGSVATHVDDLKVCGGGIREALRASGAEMWVVGTGVGVRAQLRLTDDPHATGWVELADYPAVYAGLDIALVPLQPNAFNEAKSWLKGLEAAALGVPFVASPTSPYRALVDAGAGCLAGYPDDWARIVTLLAIEEGQRVELAGRGREVAAAWTFDRHADRWLAAWLEALAGRRRRKVPVVA